MPLSIQLASCPLLELTDTLGGAEHHVVQDLSICARFGSTSELNARSQPSSACPGVGFG